MGHDDEETIGVLGRSPAEGRYTTFRPEVEARPNGEIIPVCKGGEACTCNKTQQAYVGPLSRLSPGGADRSTQRAATGAPTKMSGCAGLDNKRLHQPSGQPWRETGSQPKGKHCNAMDVQNCLTCPYRSARTMTEPISPGVRCKQHWAHNDRGTPRVCVGGWVPWIWTSSTAPTHQDNVSATNEPTMHKCGPCFAIVGGGATLESFGP